MDGAPSPEPPRDQDVSGLGAASTPESLAPSRAARQHGAIIGDYNTLIQQIQISEDRVSERLRRLPLIWLSLVLVVALSAVVAYYFILNRHVEILLARWEDREAATAIEVSVHRGLKTDHPMGNGAQPYNGRDVIRLTGGLTNKDSHSYHAFLQNGDCLKVVVRAGGTEIASATKLINMLPDTFMVPHGSDQEECQ